LIFFDRDDRKRAPEVILYCLNYIFDAKLTEINSSLFIGYEGDIG